MEQPSMDPLQSQAMPQVGAAVAAAKHRILARWRDAVKRVLPQADELTRKQLEDTLPPVLDRMATALASDSPVITDELIALSPDHGRTRYHQEFSLNELLVEYHILRRIVLEEVARQIGRDLRTQETIAINQSIDIGLRQSAVAYADHQTSALKVESAAMTKFLSFLSHDMRGGLNGAVLMIEVLKRELVREEKFASAVEDLEVVRRSILDTVSMMERFLNAEKLRHGRIPVKMASVTVADLFSELSKAFAYQLQDRGVEMHTHIDPADLQINSDRELLIMVLQNLISNAIKYAGRKDIELTAAAGADKIPAELECRFAVRDQGPGIAPEKLGSIFAPFARGETYGQKGIGLGLFIARQAADLLHARIFAESTPGQGATFYLDVPRRPESA